MEYDAYHYLLKRIVEKLSLCNGAAIICQYTNIIFYSSFEKNCRQIVNCSSPSTKKPPLNLLTRQKCPQKRFQRNIRLFPPPPPHHTLTRNIQASEMNSESSQAYNMGTLAKTVNDLKLILKVI